MTCARITEHGHSAQGGPAPDHLIDDAQVWRPGSGRRDVAAALYRLMAWLSPSFPVGAFSYSSGIEWAVEAGDITDAATLARLAAVMLERGRRLLRRGVVRARASRGRLRAMTRRCARSPNSPPPSRRRRSAISKRPRRAAPSSTATRAAWPCAGARPAAGGLGRRRSPIRSRSASRRRPRHCAGAGAARLSACRRRPTGFPPACG